MTKQEHVENVWVAIEKLQLALIGFKSRDVACRLIDLIQAWATHAEQEVQR